MPTDSARSRAETNQQSCQTAKCDPVGVPVLRGCTRDVVTYMVAGNTEESHGDDPGYQGANGCEGGEEGHENCAYAVVASATQAENDRETCKASGDGVKNQGDGQTVEDTGIKFGIIVSQAIWWESVADRCL